MKQKNFLFHEDSVSAMLHSFASEEEFGAFILEAHETARQICMRAKRVEETHNYEKMSVEILCYCAKFFRDNIELVNQIAALADYKSRREPLTPDVEHG